MISPSFYSRTEVGSCNFFLCPQLQHRNLKKHNGNCKSTFSKTSFSATAYPHICSHNFFSSQQLHVPNFLKRCCPATEYPHFFNWLWKCRGKKLTNCNCVSLTFDFHNSQPDLDFDPLGFNIFGTAIADLRNWTSTILSRIWIWIHWDPVLLYLLSAAKSWLDPT